MSTVYVRTPWNVQRFIVGDSFPVITPDGVSIDSTQLPAVLAAAMSAGVKLTTSSLPFNPGATSGVAGAASLSYPVTPHSVALSNPLNLEDGVYNNKPSNTRNTRYGLGLAKAGLGPYSAVRTGASISMGLATTPDTFGPNQAGPTKFLGDFLGARTGLSRVGTGWALCSLDGSGLGRKDSRWAFSAGVVLNPTNNAAVFSGTGAMTATFTPDVAFTKLQLLIINQDAAATYKIGSAAAVNMPTGAFGVPQLLTITVASQAAGTAVVISSSLSTGIFLFGARAYNPALGGMELHGLAFSGSAAPAWRTDGAFTDFGSVAVQIKQAEQWHTIFVGLDPLVNSIWGGSAGTELANVAQGITDMNQQITKWRSYTDSDVVLVLPHQVNNVSPGVGGATLTDDVWAHIVQGCYSLADSYDVPLLDMDTQIGGPITNVPYNVWTNDAAHLKAQGYAVDGMLLNRFLREAAV